MSSIQQFFPSPANDPIAVQRRAVAGVSSSREALVRTLGELTLICRSK